MAKQEALVISQKLGDKIDTVKAMKELIEQKKKELDSLNGNYAALHARMVSEENKIARSRSEFNDEMSREKSKHESNKNTKLNELSHREDVINRGELNLAERLKSVSARELEAEKVVAERSQLFVLRVDTEKTKSHYDIELSKALALQTEAQNKLNEVSVIRNTADNKLKTSNDQLLILSAKEDNLRVREEEIKKRLESIVALKSDIDPKLEELSAQRDKNEKILADIRVKELQVEAKTQESNRILDAAVVQSKVNKTKSIELDTREKEVLRKEMLENVR